MGELLRRKPNQSPCAPPYYSDDISIDDNLYNTDWFNKGVGNLWSGSCTGSHPTCREWWAINWRGWNGDSYLTLANGQLPPSNDAKPNWVAWDPINYLEYGLYEIFVYIPDLNSAYYPNDTFTWQAKYKIVDYFGVEHTAIVDEYIGDGQNYNPRNAWLSIGVYTLGCNSYVYLTDATGEASNTHCPEGPIWPEGSGQAWCRMLVDVVKFSQIQKRIFIPHVVFPIPFVGDPYP